MHMKTLTSSACMLSISESNSDPRYVRWNTDIALKNRLTPYTHTVYNRKKKKRHLNVKMSRRNFWGNLWTRDLILHKPKEKSFYHEFSWFCSVGQITFLFWWWQSFGQRFDSIQALKIAASRFLRTARENKDSIWVLLARPMMWHLL